jgi:ATP-binding cassette subfamily B multidrug efflux pump
LKQIYIYYKPYLLNMIVIILLLFLQAMAELALPDLMARIIDQGVILGNISFIFEKGIQMVLLSLLGVFCAAWVGFLASRVGAKVGRDLRNGVFEKVTTFSNREFDKFSTASLITRSTNDIQQIQMITIIALRMVSMAPMMAIGALVRALNKSPSLSWTIALALAAVLLVILVVFSVSLPRFRKVQKLIDKLNLIVNERLSGVMVIRAFNTQEHERDRFEASNVDLTKLNLFVHRTMAFMRPMMMFIMSGISILIVWVASKSIDMGDMPIGDMLAFIQYTMQVISSFLMLSMVFIMLPRAMVSVQRIAEVLATEATILDPEDLGTEEEDFKANKKGIVEFRNVSFKYPDAEEYVLKNISFTARPGEITAFIGSTGSGKSTLVNLIPRFYDATEGQVLVEGVNVKKVSQKQLREKIGYIPQKSVLFSGTIETNLRYGDKGASAEDLDWAIEIAQAKDFILEKPEALSSAISQGGSNVSGGQKQRLSIGRALVKKPNIYIFDDSFSALDFKTDVALRKALKKEVGDSTLLIVAQRINTIKNAEQIVVLDNGNIAGIGKHDELLESCHVYREIAMSQLNQEELS